MFLNLNRYLIKNKYLIFILIFILFIFFVFCSFMQSLNFIFSDVCVMIFVSFGQNHIKNYTVFYTFLLLTLFIYFVKIKINKLNNKNKVTLFLLFIKILNIIFKLNNKLLQLFSKGILNTKVYFV